MGKASKYSVNNNPGISDLLFGSKDGKEQNVPIEAVINILNSVAGKDYIQYKFSPADFISVGSFTSNGSKVNPTEITKLFLNKKSTSKEDLSVLFNKLDTLQNIALSLRNPSDANNFVTFKIINITTHTDYFEFDVVLYKNFYSGNLLSTSSYSLYFDVKENFEDKTNTGGSTKTAQELDTDIQTRVEKVTGKSLVSDAEIEKLINLDNTKDIDKPVSTAQQAAIDAAVQAQLVDSTLINGVTTSSSVPPTGNIHAIGIGAGTYPNWGGMVIPANNIGTLQRVGGVYSVSLTGISGLDLLATKEEIKLKANLEVGKNLFNKDDSDILMDSCFGGGGTTVYTQSPMLITGFVPVTPLTTYICNAVCSGFAQNYYDINKNYLSSVTTDSNFITPSGAYFLRRAINYVITPLANIQIELGTVSTFLEAYKESVLVKELGNAALKSDFDLLKYNVDLKQNKSFGKNLFNKDSSNIQVGYLDATGNIISISGYRVSHFIPVIPSATYTISNDGLGGARNAYYDVNKNFIDDFGTGTITIPSNVYFVRLSISASFLFLAQFELGNSATSYKAYTELAFLEPITLSIVNKLDKEVGKNLIDKNSPDIQIGKFYGADGSLYINSLYNATGLISVKPSTTYTHSNLGLGGAACVICDIDGLVIDYFSSSDPETFTTPSNGYFVKLSIQVATMDIAQLEEGTVATLYFPYTNFAPLEPITEKLPNRQVSVILPKKLYFLKNHQSCIYYENVLLQSLNGSGNIYFNKGVNYNRQTTFNFSSAGTNQILNSLLVDNYKRIESKNITYDVIDPASNNGKTVNALFIGDSFTDIGTYIKEVKRLVELQGVTFNLLGTCGNSTFRAEGLSGGRLDNTFLNNSSGVARIVTVSGVTVLPSSSYPGQNYQDSNGNIWDIRGGKIDGSGNGKIVVTRYGAVNGDFTTFPSSGVLTKIYGEGDTTISYSSPVNAYFNPFINHSTGVLDLPAYISYWGFATPNVIVFQFTWNDLALWLTDNNINTVVNNFKTAVDHVHTSYPSAKVVLSIEPYGSVNGNLDWNGKKFTVLRFVELMLTQFEDNSAYNTWVKIAPSYAYVDLINGYSGGATVIPCERYPSINEESGGDGVHPNTGMLQIADCITPVISAII